jgi:single-stranded-DNA-specific exonuclease
MDYQLIYPELSAKNGYGPIERIFTSRGIVPEAINHYLNTNDRDVLDPLLLSNMEKGAKMFIDHLANNHKIFIQVDSDVDGFTSAATLMNYAFRLAPASVKNNFAYRLHEGKCHGIMSDNVPDGY